MEKKLVGPLELAKTLNVPVSWVYQRTSAGKGIIPFIKVGKYVRFDLDEVLEFLKNIDPK